MENILTVQLGSSIRVIPIFMKQIKSFHEEILDKDIQIYRRFMKKELGKSSSKNSFIPDKMREFDLKGFLKYLEQIRR